MIRSTYASVPRGLFWAVIISIIVLLGLRDVHLDADFPNHTYWADDPAKYSDEGWYDNAAMDYMLLGQWHLRGDWAPATVVPVWPLVLTGVFHFTGVSVKAARATEVVFSWISFLLAWLIFRRYNGPSATLLFLLLAAASSVAYIFSRLAILEFPLAAAVLACLWISCCLRRESFIQPILLGAMLAVLVLTKTTAVFLFPAILYPIWFQNRSQWKQIIRPLLIALAVTWILLFAEYLFFARHYAGAVAAFFGSNEPYLGWLTLRKAVRLLYRGTWVDPVLWPFCCIALLSSLWMRSLWRNLFWGVSVLWIVGYAAFIIYKFEGSPRYFTTMLFPIFMMSVMFTAELWRRRHVTAWAAWAAMAICGLGLLTNLWRVQRYVLHPEYTMLHATQQIESVLDAHPESNRFLIGHAANETSLFIGVPSIDDNYGDGTQTQKLADYNPGWVLIWNDESLSTLAGVMSQRRLVPMLDVPAFDDPHRDHLLLFQLLPLPSSPERKP